MTSDDLFMLDHPPKKTLLVGASFIALECAGFLHHLGFDVTVMVRSILLRGFDQECANKIGDFMKNEGIHFLHNMVPTELQRLPNGRILVKYQGSGFANSEVRGEEEFIFWGDLFSTSGETATELGASLTPKARSAVNLVLAALFTAGCVAGTINAAGHAAARLQPPPEETVTRQYAALCLERDEGIAPEQLESAALTLVPEEEWEGGLQDLYAYTFTWQADGGQASRCYGVVLYSDFTCELVGRGDGLDACVADAERYWMQL